MVFTQITLKGSRFDLKYRASGTAGGIPSLCAGMTGVGSRFDLKYRASGTAGGIPSLGSGMTRAFVARGEVKDEW